MSLILDALRRAEETRSRDLGHRVGHGLPLRKHRSAWGGWGVAALILLVTTGVWYLASAPAPVEPLPTAAPAIATAPPAVTAPEPMRGSSLAEIPVPVPARAEQMPRSDAPLLHELPDTLRAAIPSLSVDAHVWSADPSRRFVLLNMRRYRDGEQVAAGLRVVTILPEGVEMDWHGTRFRVLSR